MYVTKDSGNRWIEEVKSYKKHKEFIALSLRSVVMCEAPYEQPRRNKSEIGRPTHNGSGDQKQE
jgi:hypothetical protein